MLRDLLVRLDGAGTWPCDEINYIWRHGNVRFPSDVLQPEMARPGVRQYVSAQFGKLARSNALDTIVEKTCANSLRVPFVNEIVSDAKYIFILRDGIDTVASALKRWGAEMDFSYLLKKARFVPPTDLPYYGFRFVANQMHRVSSSEKRLSSWGPVIDNMAALQKAHSTIEICALQWQACVEKSKDALQNIPADRVFRVRYENFVDDPRGEFSRIADFVGKEVPDSLNEYLTGHVSATSKGKGRSELGEKEMDLLLPLIGQTLADYEYH